MSSCLRTSGGLIAKYGALILIIYQNSSRISQKKANSIFVLSGILVLHKQFKIVEFNIGQQTAPFEPVKASSNSDISVVIQLTSYVMSAVIHRTT